jgi:NPCBM/NEW2 domain
MRAEHHIPDKYDYYSQFSKAFRGPRSGLILCMADFGTWRRRRMASHEKERAGSRKETPADLDAEQEQSLTRYATIVGIVTGLFGMLLGVGLILLPSATTREKVLVIAACLAVSVAGLTGVGAWRSPRKFALTMLAGGLAIVCLADLSIAAADKAQATSQSTATPPAKPSAANSPAPTTSSPSPSPSPTVVFLSHLTWNPGQVGEAPELGPWTMNGTNYNQSIGYPPTAACTSPNNITYTLGRNSYKSFLAEVGVADGWMSGDRSTEVGFIVSGKTGTGNFYAIHSVSVRVGHPTELNLPIRPGTEELQLVTTLSAGCLHSAMVWGNARLTG